MLNAHFVFLHGLALGVAPSPHSSQLLEQSSYQNLLSSTLFCIGGLVVDLAIVSVSRIIGDQVTFSPFIQCVLYGIGILHIFYLLRKTFKVTKTFNVQKNLTAFSAGMYRQFFNPNPYLFWFSVGTSFNLENPIYTLLFLATVYGVKMSLVIFQRTISKGSNLNRLEPLRIIHVVLLSMCSVAYSERIYQIMAQAS